MTSAPHERRRFAPASAAIRSDVRGICWPANGILLEHLEHQVERFMANAEAIYSYEGTRGVMGDAFADYRASDDRICRLRVD